MIQALHTLLSTVFYLYLSRNTVYAAIQPYVITIDDSSPDIQYNGGDWNVAPYQVDYGGSQHVVDLGPAEFRQSSSTASFTFTGTAIYYWAPLYPYTTSTCVTLDSGPINCIKLTTNGGLVPEGSTGPSVASSIRWSQQGLSNTQHTLVISLPPAASSRYIVVDALSYTILVDDATAPPTSSAVSGSGINPPLRNVSSASSTISGSSSISNISISATSGSSPPSGHQFAPTDASGHAVPLPSGSSSSPNNSGVPGSPGPLGTGASNSHRRNTLLIICATIGALLGLTIAGIIVFLMCRKRRIRVDGASPSLSPFQVDSTLPNSNPTEDAKAAKHPPSSESPSDAAPVDPSPNHIELFAQFIASLPEIDENGTAPPPYEARRASQPAPRY